MRISVTRIRDQQGFRVVNKKNGQLLGHCYKNGMWFIQGFGFMEGIETKGFMKNKVVAAFNTMYEKKQADIRREMEG